MRGEPFGLSQGAAREARVPDCDMLEQSPHADFHAAMPTMRHHAGVWEGTYRHVDADGQVLDSHASRVACEFPDEGPFAYIQRNRFTWEDGRTHEAVLEGTFRGGRLWWDAPTFHGYAWEHEGVVFLELERKDEPGATMREAILMGARPGEREDVRSRTWHWFRDGKLFRRTLVEERRTA